MTPLEYCQIAVERYLSEVEKIEASDYSSAAKRCWKYALANNLFYGFSFANYSIAEKYGVENGLDWPAVREYTMTLPANTEEKVELLKVVDFTDPLLYIFGLYPYAAVPIDSRKFGFDYANPDLVSSVRLVEGRDNTASQIAQLSLLYTDVNGGKIASEAELAEIEPLRNEYPSLVDYIKDLNDKTIEKAARFEEIERRVMSRANEIPSSSMNDEKISIIDFTGVAWEEVIPILKNRFKGKVLFIDFWETWCGPCQMALKESKTAKGDYSKDDVVFIFIASESSPKGKWQQEILDIDGVHIYLTKEQCGAIRDYYKEGGVPAYLVFDKSGNQNSFSVGWRGVEWFKKAVNNALSPESNSK